MQKGMIFIKKIFTILVMVCLLTAALTITAFAEDSTTVVLSISGIKKDGTTIGLNHWTNFADGWEAAIDFAEDEDFMDEHELVRIVVDLKADWKANSKGEFGKSSWDGFQYTTIYVPDDVRITINMNGYTIDRGLTKWEWNGEVICIDENADVIINNGTIKGGYSGNGAGGIHICDGADVTLNNVTVCNNRIDDDYGMAIGLFNGATLTMIGGSISDNTSYATYAGAYGGGVYINDAKATFKGVTFQNNQGVKFPTYGAAVFVDDGTLVMEECKVIGNGLTGKYGDVEYVGAYSIIDASNISDVTIKNTTFSSNGYAQEALVSHNTWRYTSVIRAVASNLTIEEKCDFSDNNQVFLIDSAAAILTVRETDFTGNNSFAFYGHCASGYDNTFTDCKFSYNEPMLKLNSTFNFLLNNVNLKFVDCDFGGATFNKRSAATFVDSEPVASIFGEGSLTMIVAIIAILALIASAASIFLIVDLKKKLVPAENNNSFNGEDEK